jgi:predicted dehydrogenase
LQGIRLIEPTLGETVVVYGLGLIGLITVQLLKANGCRVIGIDINQNRLALASDFGAEVIHGAECPDVVRTVQSLTGNSGADAVIITASSKTDEIASQSAKMCRKRGRVVLVGVVGLNLKRSDFYEKEISFQVSCSYGPGRYDPRYEQGGHDYPLGYVRWTEQRNFEAILGMLSRGAISFSKLVTHRFAHQSAANAYAAIQQDASALGVLLEYPDQCSQVRTIALPSSQPAAPALGLTAAVIGAGNFTRATLMPALRGLPMRIKYMVGRSGGSAVQHLASRFQVPYASTDLAAVLADPDVHLVIITTNHDSHASLATQALESGKHVFVEKPLALDVEQLALVVQAWKSDPSRRLAVGFNRRFSPHVAKCQDLLRGRVAPLAIDMLVNAGSIPAGHWVHDERVGGGRIIGEACHFLDLVVALTGSRIVSVTAQRMGKDAALRDDKSCISVLTEDGSIASINYFANGSKSFPKETITIFSDDRVLKIDNFRRTEGFDFKGFRRIKTLRPEKGHAQQFAKWTASLVGGGDNLIPVPELVNVTLASIAAVQAARSEQSVRIEDLEKQLG